MRQRLAHIGFSGGYNSGAPQDYEGDILAYGSKNLIYREDGKPVVFPGIVTSTDVGTRSMFPFASGSWVGLGVYADGASSGQGAVWSGPGLSMWFTGNGGTLVKDGASLSTTASLTPQMRLRVSSAWTGAGTGPYNVGVAAPAAPTLAVKSGSSGNIRGAISAKITAVRNATGAESNASNVSSVVTFNGETARLTFPSLGSNGEDRWRIYLPKQGFADKGNFYFWKEITDGDLSTIDAVARSYEINYTDADLEPRLAPIDNDVPPSSWYGLIMEGACALIGCYSDVSGISVVAGAAIAVSLPNHPEAFPADNRLFLPGSPTGVITLASESHAWVFGNNWLGALVYTGANPLPMSFQLVWAGTGFPYVNSACVAGDGRLYGCSSQRGIVRMGIDGQPDVEFARPVQKDTESWTGNPIVAWDQYHQLVHFMNGTTILSYSVASQKWCAPCDISTQTSAVTGTIISATSGIISSPVSGMFLSILNSGGGTLRSAIYAPPSFGDGSTWEAYSTWRMPSPGVRKTITNAGGMFNYNKTTGSITTKFYANNSATASKTATQSVSAVGTHNLVVNPKPNIRNARNFRVYQSAVGAGPGTNSSNSGPLHVWVEGVTNSIR